jgi:hypothetical protein
MVNPKVFICHASEDKERFVLRFAERLRSKGIEAWLDKWEMLPGDRLVGKVFNSGLKPSDAVIVVLSEISIKKPWVQKELETAVVKSIEEQIRLIPIRLDKCEVPACLKDTLYQEVSDLDNYDSDFERIVNAIYGQYERPPLGERPLYVRPDGLSIDGLTPIDMTIFEHACRIALEQGHADFIDAKRLVSELDTKGISEAQIMETQDVIERRSYIEPKRVVGPPSACDFAITTDGFEEFAQVGIPNYGTIVTSIARFLAQEVSGTEGQYSRAIAGKTGQTVFLVEHILKVLAGDGLIKCDGVEEGDIYVFWVSPELRRKLEGNN